MSLKVGLKSWVDCDVTFEFNSILMGAISRLCRKQIRDTLILFYKGRSRFALLVSTLTLPKI